DAESVLHNSDSESEFMSGVGGACGSNFYESVDYSNISIPQGFQGLQGNGGGFSLYGNPFSNHHHSQQIHHNHNTDSGHSIFMEDNSNSSSNNDQTENEQSPSCFLLESSSLQSSLDA